VPWASTAAWAADRSPAHRAWAVPDSGPRNRARAVRTQLWAALAPSRSRPRSQLAVEAAGAPWSAPAAPRASRLASSRSHWPSRRSTSRRNSRVWSARAASGKPSRSSVARSSTTAASAASLPGGLPGGRSRPSGEHLFDSMAATYQAHHRTQAPTRICGQNFRVDMTRTIPATVGRLHGSKGSRGHRARGEYVGPYDSGPPCQASTWGPRTQPTTHRAKPLNEARITQPTAPGKQMVPNRAGEPRRRLPRFPALYRSLRKGARIY
jgi:hypothetical protein